MRRGAVRVAVRQSTRLAKEQRKATVPSVFKRVGYLTILAELAVGSASLPTSPTARHRPSSVQAVPRIAQRHGMAVVARASSSLAAPRTLTLDSRLHSARHMLSGSSVELLARVGGCRAIWLHQLQSRLESPKASPPPPPLVLLLPSFLYHSPYTLTALQTRRAP